jgi:hypothetical protein
VQKIKGNHVLKFCSSCLGAVDAELSDDHNTGLPNFEQQQRAKTNKDRGRSLVIPVPSASN